MGASGLKIEEGKRKRENLRGKKIKIEPPSRKIGQRICILVFVEKHSDHDRG